MKSRRHYYMPCVVYMGCVYQIISTGAGRYHPEWKDLILTTHEEALKIYNRRIFKMLIGRGWNLESKLVLFDVIAVNKEQAEEMIKYRIVNNLY